jgi:hypothetical protein
LSRLNSSQNLRYLGEPKPTECNGDHSFRIPNDRTVRLPVRDKSWQILRRKPFSPWSIVPCCSTTRLGKRNILQSSCRAAGNTVRQPDRRNQGITESHSRRLPILPIVRWCLKTPELFSRVGRSSATKPVQSKSCCVPPR